MAGGGILKGLKIVGKLKRVEKAAEAGSLLRPVGKLKRVEPEGITISAESEAKSQAINEARGPEKHPRSTVSKQREEFNQVIIDAYKPKAEANKVEAAAEGPHPSPRTEEEWQAQEAWKAKQPTDIASKRAQPEEDGDFESFGPVLDEKGNLNPMFEEPQNKIVDLNTARAKKQATAAIDRIRGAKEKMKPDELERTLLENAADDATKLARSRWNDAANDLQDQEIEAWLKRYMKAGGLVTTRLQKSLNTRLSESAQGRVSERIERNVMLDEIDLKIEASNKKYEHDKRFEKAATLAGILGDESATITEVAVKKKEMFKELDKIAVEEVALAKTDSQILSILDNYVKNTGGEIPPETLIKLRERMTPDGQAFINREFNLSGETADIKPIKPKK